VKTDFSLALADTFRGALSLNCFWLPRFAACDPL
jgi:hypothetical protein